HHRSASSYPAALASHPSGSSRMPSAGSGADPSSPGPSSSAASPSEPPSSEPPPSEFSPSEFSVSVPAGGASWWAAGRSQKRTGTPAPRAYRIACHSGLNSAKGQNAALRSPRSPPAAPEAEAGAGEYASSATGGAIPGSPASSTIGSASGGPSISTA